MSEFCFWLCICMILYVYAGYPLIITLLARRFPRKARPVFTDLPTVSLIISAYNEEQAITGKLENSLKLQYPRELLEIIVVSDGNQDHTRELTLTYADKGVLSEHCNERHGKSAALNRGIRRATGEILLFSDANNHYADDAVLRLVAPFAESSVGLVTGAKLIRGDTDALEASESKYWQYESFIKKQETRFNSTTGVAGEILAVRKADCPQIPDVVINDDAYIAMRIALSGKRIVYEPGARSYERISATAEDEHVRRARIAAGRLQLLKLFFVPLLMRRPLYFWQVLSHKFLRLAVPLAMLGALVFNIFALTDAFYMVVVFFLQLLFYAAAVLSSKFASRSGRLARICYLPGYLIGSNAATLRGMAGYFFNTQQSAWRKVQRRDG